MRPQLGLLEWFQIGEYERVETVVEDLKRLNLSHIRTGVSWADYLRPDGPEWYHWLLKRLAQDAEVLPCCLYTPPSEGEKPRTSSPPRNRKAYADWIDQLVAEAGDSFDYVELWNEPNNLTEWDWTLDSNWFKFAEMVGGAAYWCKQLGKKTVLGGMCPADPNWLKMMFERGVMQYIDVVGLHGFPFKSEATWDGWGSNIALINRVLQEHGSEAKIWISETGHSTWRNDEHAQLQSLLDALNAPVERVYWYGVKDLDPDLAAQDGFHVDEREYHFGLRRADGSKKLLYRLWEAGQIPHIERAAAYPTPVSEKRFHEHVLITGGSGFVGTNLADRLIRNGHKVVVFDNLSRPGVEQNLEWLRKTHGSNVQFVIGDVRDRYAIRGALEGATQVFHFAAQVAVTTSLDDPITDFDVNARGTLNLLEEMRRLKEPPGLVFTSTNKVYGGLEDVALSLRGNRYEPSDPIIRMGGISEERPLDFHSPYGCSKGTADQYVVDYARCMGVKSVVFRMSCIYGQHQFGTEDQGWVAHFIIKALRGEPITLYGDGKQVRDILFVEDLVDAFLLAHEHMDDLSGEAFNIGGGPKNTVSLLELIDLIKRLQGVKPDVDFSMWRPGDQRYYVSDYSKFNAATGWAPKYAVSEGVESLFRWLGGKSAAGSRKSRTQSQVSMR